MSKENPSDQSPLTRFAESAVDSILRQLSFCLPGRIVSFDAATQTASVEAGIQRVANGEPVTIPIIEDVPVCFAGDGQFYFFHQITPGETEGLIHFSERALDNWLNRGGPIEPHDLRLLDTKDAVFVPGVRSKPGAITGFKNDGAGISNYGAGVFVHLKSDNSAEITATSGTTINSNVQINGSLSVTGPITSDTEVTASGVNLTTHTHPGDSGGTTGQPN